MAPEWSEWVTNELEALSSVYPDSFHFEAIAPDDNGVDTPSAHRGSVAVSVELPPTGLTVKSPTEGGDTFTMMALPPVILDFQLSSNYPEDSPSLKLACPWLNQMQLDTLESALSAECEQYVGSTMLDLVIDMLRHQTLDILDIQTELLIPSIEAEGQADSYSDAAFEAICEFRKSEDKRQFIRQRHTCGICFEAKLGSHSHQFHDCDHTYCQNCIHGYFQMLVAEGLVDELRCPHSACRRKPEGRLSDTELALILGPDDMAQFRTHRDEQMCLSDPNSAWCPLPTCKRRVVRADPAEKLLICPHCRFAFCFMCRRTWHGSQTYCPLPNTQKVAELYLACTTDAERIIMERKYGKRPLLLCVKQFQEEEATQAWLEQHATPCPTCGTNIQKSHGCNHMKCHMCNTHFCFLCGSFIPKDNPYLHFNSQSTTCHMRLFEGVMGDPVNPVDEEADEIRMLLQAAELE
ncbi:hypothetical protein H4R33_005551 [Dimargaris cristalligena]|nr:hypothetical protein H4R33_005551 [Dimargaris cristalligena]